MARGHENNSYNNNNNSKLYNMNSNAHTTGSSNSSSNEHDTPAKDSSHERTRDTYQHQRERGIDKQGASQKRDTPQSNDTPAKDIADITLLERVTAARFNRIVDPAIAREEARNIGKGVALCDRSTILTEEHEARDRAEAAAKGLDSYDTRETEAGLLEPVRPDPLPLPAETDPRAVVMLLVGKTPREVSDTLDIPLETLLTLADHPSMLGACQSIRDNLLQDILHGTHGPIAMARAASNEMVSHVIGLARRPAQPEVQRKSAIDILAIAGYGPTKRIETVNMNEWWSDMTPEEVRHYARTREWPARFADLVTRPLPIKKVEKEGR